MPFADTTKDPIRDTTKVLRRTSFRGLLIVRVGRSPSLFNAASGNKSFVVSGNKSFVGSGNESFVVSGNGSFVVSQNKSFVGKCWGCFNMFSLCSLDVLIYFQMFLHVLICFLMFVICFNMLQMILDALICF